MSNAETYLQNNLIERAHDTAREYARLKSQEDNAELIEALNGIIKINVDKYEADLRYASEVNNSPGAGKTFDYYCASPLPEWVKNIQSLISRHTPPQNQG